ncbi:hypothetical protein HDU81_006192 [Chytriomyces hyalinus]|nr:hypothetical protein HDU81_006192 [Chytriomyces hyalinus]
MLEFILASIYAPAQVFPTTASPLPQIPFTIHSAENINVSISTLSTRDSLPLQEYPNVMTEYRASIQVGGRQFTVLLDTGSHDMWLYGDACPSPACTSAKNKYSASRSASGLDLKTPAPGGSYADGSGYRGNLVQDTVTMGSVTLPSFAFTQVTQYISQGGSFNPIDNDVDGIIGMAFSPQTGSSKSIPTFMEQAIMTRALPAGIFSFFIDVSERAGTATLGGYDATLFSNSVDVPVWIPILKDGSFSAGKLALPLIRSYVGTTVVDQFQSHGSLASSNAPQEGITGSAVIDTGTSQSIVSYKLLDALAQQLPNAKKVPTTQTGADYVYTVPCDLKRENRGPSVSLQFANGVKLSVSALEYVSRPSKNGVCQILIQGSNLGGLNPGTYLIGNTVLKRFVTVFDYQNQQIGFALAKGRSGAGKGVEFDAGVASTFAAGLGTSTKSIVLCAVVLASAVLLASLCLCLYIKCKPSKRVSALKLRTGNVRSSYYSTTSVVQVYPDLDANFDRMVKRSSRLAEMKTQARMQSRLSAIDIYEARPLEKESIFRDISHQFFAVDKKYERIFPRMLKLRAVVALSLAALLQSALAQDVQELAEEPEYFEIPMATTPNSMAPINTLLKGNLDANSFSARFMNYFVSKAATASNDSDITLQEYQHVMTEYRAMVQVGAPAKVYNLLLDTGSFDMWIYGATCESEACKNANNKYDVTKSTSGVNLNKTALGGKYADGSGYGGFRVTDDVAIGAAALKAFEFTQVTSYVSQGGSNRFNPSDADSDGIVGMGLHPQVLGGSVTNSFIEQVISSKALKSNTFSYFIDVMETGGTATLGGWNPNLFQNTTAAPSFVSLLSDDSIKDGKLALPLLRVIVSKNGDSKVVDKFTSHASSSGAPEGSTGSAIIDTGTSQAIVSNALIEAIGSAIPGARRARVGRGGAFTYIMDCNSKAENGGPTVTLEFAGGVQITVTALEYVSAPVNGQCQLMLQGADGGFRQGTYLIGNTFLKRYVTVFDYDQRRIGFALGKGRSTDASISFNPNAPGVLGGVMRNFRNYQLVWSSVLLALGLVACCGTLLFRRMQLRRNGAPSQMAYKQNAPYYAQNPQPLAPFQQQAVYPVQIVYPNQPAYPAQPVYPVQPARAYYGP